MLVAERKFRKRRGEDTAPYLPNWKLLLGTALNNMGESFRKEICVSSLGREETLGGSYLSRRKTPDADDKGVEFKFADRHEQPPGTEQQIRREFHNIFKRLLFRSQPMRWEMRLRLHLHRILRCSF